MQPKNNFKLTSSAFVEGTTIPGQYGCKGQNVSPPLEISGTPEGTVDLALVMHDPDAPVGDFLHWSVWNLKPNLGSMTEGTLPAGARQGTSGFGRIGYGGPCPPSGTHHYVFDLYALDTQLELPTGASWQDVMAAIQDHTIAQTMLMGTYTAR